MPKYSYKCEMCNYMFDVQQKITDDPLKKCPKCSKKIYKVISSNVGITFKGKGFYVNDSKSCPAAKSDSPKCETCKSKNNKQKKVN